MVERCGSRGGVSSLVFYARYVAVRRAACLYATNACLYVCDALLWTAMGFSGRSAITAGRSTARRVLTSQLVSSAIERRNAIILSS